MKIINNHSEYLDARYKLDQYNFCVKEYCKNNKTNGIPIEIGQTFPFAKFVDNDLRSAVEVWEFRINPPKKYTAYVDLSAKKLTTWTGQELGNITHVGKEFISNMGDKRQYIKTITVNGLMYGGIFFKSSGDYARIKQLNQ